MDEGKEEAVCLGIVCIMLEITAGCTQTGYAYGDMTEKDVGD